MNKARHNALDNQQKAVRLAGFFLDRVGVYDRCRVSTLTSTITAPAGELMTRCQPVEASPRMAAPNSFRASYA